MSVSSYYDWRSRPVSQRVLENEKLLFEIQRIHQDSKENYGTIKTWKVLNTQGIRCGKHRVARLRRLHRIVSKRRRRFKVTTDSRDSKWLAPNRLNRNFQAHQPNRVWCGDVTFVATHKGWLYVAVLLDLFSRKVIGWSMSDRNDTTLVLNALEMALLRRKPKGGLIHHTDRGRTYASDDYRDTLRKNALIPSMSRKADCYDNAVAESFFSTLKNELTHGQRFITREQAKSEIFQFIEVFYNRKRVHQTLNYQTPEQVELKTVP